MSQSAYIKFVDGSAVASLTLDELKDLLLKYKDQLTLTGQQLDWEYGDKGFPYAIETRQQGDGHYLYLKGTDTLYHYIVAGVGKEAADEGKDRHYVQIVLPEGATSGDKSKANEFCKHLARQLKAELHLFNKRVMYYNPRK